MRINGFVGVSLARKRAAIVLAAGAAVSLAAFAPAARAQTWIGTTSGNFSDPTKWSSNPSAPTSGTSTALVFGPPTPSAVTVTFDGSYAMPTPFQANSLTFTNWAGFSVTASPTTNTIQMSGTAPSLNLSSMGTVSFTVPLDLAANTTIGGTGVGNLLCLSAISGTGGITIPALPAALTTTAAGQVFHSFSTSNTGSFTGGLTLDGGNLVIPSGGSSGDLGPTTGTLTVTGNGGTMQLPGTGGTPSVGTLEVDGQLRFIGPGTMTRAATLNGTMAASALVMNGTGTFTITTNAATSFTGAVTIDKSDLPQFNLNAGTITLSGAAGALGTTAYNLRAGGTLNLTNATGAINGNRIADGASINMASGLLTANTTSATLNETVGAITGSGFSTIGMTVSSGTLPCQISASSLNRADHGTFLIRGSNLGAATAGNGLFTLTTAPTLSGLTGGTGTSIPIVPWAIGDTSGSGTGNGLVTYGTNGFRTLNTSTEYAANLTSGSTTNSRLSASASPAAGGSTVNGLVLVSGGVIPAGADALTISSGTLLYSNSTASSTTSIGVPVTFGSEANVFVAAGTATSPGTLTMSGQLSGSGGFTKSGLGNLALTADNTNLHGQLAINAGSINFSSLNALPGDTTGANSQIIVTGSGGAGQSNAAGLTCNAGTTASPLELSRDIKVNSGFLNANCAASGQALKLSGTISGPGGVFIQTPDGSDVWLTGNNTYTGSTFINFSGTSTTGGGVTHITSDASLGNGGAVDLTTKLVLEGDWTTSRMLNLNATGASTDKTIIDTQGYTATLNGPLTCYTTTLAPQTSGTIHKAGTGKLILSSSCIADAFTQSMAVDAGTLLVNNTIGPAAGSITVNANGTLGGSGTIMRPITVNGTLAPGNSPGILTEWGNLALNSGANFAVDLDGPTPGNGAGKYDQMVVNGTVTLAATTGPNLVPNLTYFPSLSDKFFILTNDAADAVANTFNGLPEGATVTLGTINSVVITAQISYLGNWEAVGGPAAPGDANYTPGNDIVLYNIVPAPGSVALMGLAGLLAARRRRR
jgi:hypothetical protein